MVVLGIDSSGLTAAAALCEDGKVLVSSSSCNRLTHSEKLLPLIDRVLEEGGRDINAIAVACGPGSFTGLRIGIATAKGLAFAKDLPCIPVVTTEALAHRMIMAEGKVLCPVMDARRNAFYNQLFKVEKGALIPLTEPRSIACDDLIARLKELDMPVVLNGDGADLFFAHAQNLPFSVSIAPPHLLLQDAASVALIGEKMYLEHKAVTCKELSPLYCRQP